MTEELANTLISEMWAAMADVSGDPEYSIAWDQCVKAEAELRGRQFRTVPEVHDRRLCAAGCGREIPLDRPERMTCDSLECGEWTHSRGG